ncbi:hypothetical protein D3C76_916120 [compost metagenome]
MEQRIKDVRPTPIVHWAGENQAPILDVVERLCWRWRRDYLIPCNMDRCLDADNVVANRRQRRKIALNFLSNSCWFVMKQTGEDV